MDATSPTSRKNNDCYFYYYSTCLKGDGCSFRHEPAALGSETVCSFWAQGKCLNQHCNFRHMELKKNRKTIPCYWETQPSGCQKPHCSFQHKNPRPGVPGETDLGEGVGVPSPMERPEYRPRRPLPVDGGESSEGEGSRRLNQNLDFNTTTVDPLVVNFEEESDNESVPTSTPTKNTNTIHIKTLEEIRLERIQAESAAFYHYDDRGQAWQEPGEEEGQREAPRGGTGAGDRTVKTLAQIRSERKARELLKENLDEDSDGSDCEREVKRRKLASTRVYKKRSHSPIKFDISYAEPSVSSSTDSVKRSKSQIGSFVPVINFGESPHVSGGRCDESARYRDKVKVSSSISGSSSAVKLQRNTKVRTIVRKLRRKPTEPDSQMAPLASSHEMDGSSSSANDITTPFDVSNCPPDLNSEDVDVNVTSNVQNTDGIISLPDTSRDNQPTVPSNPGTVINAPMDTLPSTFSSSSVVLTLESTVPPDDCTLETPCSLSSPMKVDDGNTSNEHGLYNVPIMSKSFDHDDLIDDEMLTSSTVEPSEDILQHIDDLLND